GGHGSAFLVSHLIEWRADVFTTRFGVSDTEAAGLLIQLDLRRRNPEHTLNQSGSADGDERIGVRVVPERDESLRHRISSCWEQDEPVGLASPSIRSLQP